jgi:hypothetical protein
MYKPECNCRATKLVIAGITDHINSAVKWIEWRLRGQCTVGARPVHCTDPAEGARLAQLQIESAVIAPSAHEHRVKLGGFLHCACGSALLRTCARAELDWKTHLRMRINCSHALKGAQQDATTKRVRGELANQTHD